MYTCLLRFVVSAYVAELLHQCLMSMFNFKTAST